MFLNVIPFTLSIGVCLGSLSRETEDLVGKNDALLEDLKIFESWVFAFKPASL